MGAVPGTGHELDGALPLARGEASRPPCRAAAAAGRACWPDLPQAAVAHLATHGFFADPSFRSVLQVDPKLFETAVGGRAGRGRRRAARWC